MTSKNESEGLGFHPKSEGWKKEKLKGRLALYLCEKFTHEDLASSMAHLIIERSDFRDASIKAAIEIAKETAQSVAIQAISAFKLHKKKPYQENYKDTLGPIVDRLDRAKEAAKQAARELWAKDSECQIRIGAMALKVYQVLLGTEHEGSLPVDENALRGWIADVAPDYARKGGRSRKKTP